MIIVPDIVYRDKPVSVIFEHYRVTQEAKAKRKGRPDMAWLKRYRKDKKSFTPFTRGGRTVAILCTKDGDHECNTLGNFLATGVADCSMSDVFCYATGRKIALERALNQLRSKYPTNG